MQSERFLRGQVPPELVLLTHDQREAATVGIIALPGNVAQHAGRAAGGPHQTYKNLDRGGLAGTVRADEAEDLSSLQRDRQVVERGELAESLGEFVRFDDGGLGIRHELLACG